MAAGQCKLDPPTGIAGTIYSGWIADADAGLSASCSLSGTTLRKLVGAQVEAIARAIDSTSASGHSTGTTVSWSSGTGAGQWQFREACPNGTIASGQITGCDEGGTVKYTTGAGTNSSGILTVRFAVPFTYAPAVTLQPADSATAAYVFANQWYADSTTDGWTIYTNSAPPNATYRWHWIVKGRT